MRTFTVGTRFELTQSTLDALGALKQAGSGAADTTFLLTQLTHAGINNLPKDLSEAIAKRLQEGGADLLKPWVDDAVRSQAQASGYANSFEASRAKVPWRALLVDASGARRRGRSPC